MGTAPSKPRGQSSPKHELNLSCSQCGKPALLFESFVSNGPFHELVSTKVSEMIAFLSNTPEAVRCQACAIKAREQAQREKQREKEMHDREAQRIIDQTARNEALLRQASIRSQKSLRRSGSRRGMFSRARDSWTFGDEDYLTEPEDAAGSGVRRQPSQRSVRFQDEAPGYQQSLGQQVQYQDIRASHVPEGQDRNYPMETLPPQSAPEVSDGTGAAPLSYQGPPGGQIQTQSPPPTQAVQQWQPPTHSPPPPPPPIQTQFQPQQQQQASPPPPPPAALPPPPPAGQPPPPPPAASQYIPQQHYEQSAPQPYSSAPNAVNLPRNFSPPPGPGPSTAPPPMTSDPSYQTVSNQNATRDMSYQPPPQSYSHPSYAPASNLSMPESPQDRMPDLQRQYEASQARLAQINAQQADRERQWEIEDRDRRERDRLARRAAKAEKEAERKEREIRRREQQRSNRPPPRDRSPIFFSGTKQPKRTRTREEKYILSLEGTNDRPPGPGLLDVLGVKKVLNSWEEVSPYRPANENTGGAPPPNTASRGVSGGNKKGGGFGGKLFKSILTEWEKSQGGTANTGTNTGPPAEVGSRGVAEGGAGGGAGGGGGGSLLGKVGGAVLQRVLSEWEKSYANANEGNPEGAAAPAAGSRGIGSPIKPIKNAGLTGWKKFVTEWEKSQM